MFTKRGAERDSPANQKKKILTIILEVFVCDRNIFIEVNNSEIT